MPFPISIRRLLAAGLVAGTAACGQDNLVLPTEGAPAEVVITAGDAQSGVAGSALAEPLTVLVTDGLGRPVEGQPVVFTAGASGGELTPDTALTAADGRASSAWVLGVKAGTQQVKAALIVAGVLSTELSVTFNATALAGAPKTLQRISGNNQTGSVGAALADSLVVAVVDAFDNPVAGVTVQWTVTRGGSVNPTSVVTGADGRAATRRILGTGSGAQTASAASAGLAQSPIVFQHTAVAATPDRLVYISGNAQQGPAGFPVSNPLIVRLVDASDNGVAGRVVSWVPNNGSVSPTNATTDADGYAQTRWTLNTTAGSNVVNAVFSGLPSVRFTATGTSDAPSKIVLNAGNSQSGTVGTTLPTQLSVKVTDANNNPVEGVGVTWAAVGGGSVSASTTGTDASGIARVSRTLGVTPNTYTTTATVTGLSGSPITFTSTATIGPAARLAVITQPSSAASGGVELTQQPVVQLQDALGNAVSQGGVSVTANVSGGADLTGDRVIQTATNGRATFTNLAITGAAGSYTITFIGSVLVSATSSSITLSAGTAARLALITQPSSSVASGQTFGQLPVVQVQDASGNAVSGAGRTVGVELASGAEALGGDLEATTASNGRATFSNLSITGASGQRTLRFTSSGLTPVTSNAINVTAGAATQIAVHTGNGQSSEVGTVVDVDPAVIVKDAGGNPVAGVSVTFSVASGGGSITGASATTNASGIAAVGSWKLGPTAGTNTLRATSSGLTGSPVMFTATGTVGSATQISANSAATQSAQTGAAVTAPPSVLVRDGGNNPVQGVTVTFTVTGGGGTIAPASPAAVQTGADGIATLASWTLGATAGTNNNVVTAVVTGLSGSPVTFRASATAGAATQMAVNDGDNQTANVNTVLPEDPSVIVKDANGNPVAGVTVTFSVAPGNGSLTGATVVTGASGVAQVGSWRLSTTARTNVLTASSAGLTPVTFTALGTVSTTSSVTSSNNPSLVGESVTFTGTVASTGGTPTGSMRFVIDGGEVANVTLDGAGKATFTTAALSAGSHTVRIDYQGDGGFLASNSSTLTQNVQLASTTTTITSTSPNPSTAGSSVLISVAVASALGTPEGTVTVTSSDEGASCTATLAGGAGSCNLDLTVPGTPTLTATYSGDASHQGSVGTATHEVSP